MDGILQDILALERGMEMTKKEFLVQEDNKVLQDFVKTNSNQLALLVKDGKTAQVGAQFLSNPLYSYSVFFICQTALQSIKHGELRTRKGFKIALGLIKSFVLTTQGDRVK